MDDAVCSIDDSPELIENAAAMLHATFKNLGKNAWPTYESALVEVQECIQKPNIAIGLRAHGKLLGWVGIRPMYEKVWELHPLVVESQYQKKGYGRELVKQIECLAKNMGLTGLVLGTDDENFSTSLAQSDLTKENIFSEMTNIKNIKNHPYEFYEKCGYSIVGVIPNANGKHKPDIWMWKNLE
jgi:aminoglycoside 6'-N-acetyltransferase I